MKNRRNFAAVFCMVLLLLLTGCGQKEYIVEYGVDGYVYPAKRIQTMDGVRDLKVVGDYLYYMQNTDNGCAVRRVSVALLASGEGKLDFSKRETLAEIRNMTFELPEGAEENGGANFLSALTPRSVEEEKIIHIVLEEAESYYTGDKSLEEVTELIQNRAQLLLNEAKK